MMKFGIPIPIVFAILTAGSLYENTHIPCNRFQAFATFSNWTLMDEFAPCICRWPLQYQANTTLYASNHISLTIFLPKMPNGCQGNCNGYGHINGTARGECGVRYLYLQGDGLKFHITNFVNNVFNANGYYGEASLKGQIHVG